MELGLGNASILMKLWCFGPGQEQFIHLSIWWNPNTHWAEALKLRWKSYRFGLKLKITTVLGVKNGGPNTWDRLGPPSLWCFPGSFQLPNPSETIFCHPKFPSTSLCSHWMETGKLWKQTRFLVGTWRNLHKNSRIFGKIKTERSEKFFSFILYCILRRVSGPILFVL